MKKSLYSIQAIGIRYLLLTRFIVTRLHPIALIQLLSTYLHTWFYILPDCKMGKELIVFGKKEARDKWFVALDTNLFEFFTQCTFQVIKTLEIKIDNMIQYFSIPCTANVYRGLRSVHRFSLQYLWNRAVRIRITEKLYTPQRERLCMLLGNPVIFTDCGENPMITIGFFCDSYSPFP